MSQQLKEQVSFEPDVSNEEALVASVIVNGSAAAAAQVSGSDFFDTELGKVFDLVQALHAAGEPTTGQHLENALTTAGILDEFGKERIRSIVNNSRFEAAHTRHYADRLRAESTRRKLTVELSNALSEISKSKAGTDLSNKIDELRVVLDVLGSRKSITIRSAVDIARESILDKQQKRSSPVFTGLEVYDRNFGGWCGGDLVVLAARTSIGKTALAAGIAEHNARKLRSVLFVTLEMRDSELIDRTLARLSGIPLVDLRNRSLETADYQRLNAAADSLVEVKLFIHDRPSINVAGIRASAKLTQVRNGLSLLVVDMVNLIKPDDSRRDRHEQIGQITRDLKALAKELDVPILLLAQINREAEKGNGEPSLIHLKESGSIEENADQVLLLHRADRKAIDGKLIVAKNRHGPTNMLDVEFIGEDIQFRCK